MLMLEQTGQGAPLWVGRRASPPHPTASNTLTPTVPTSWFLLRCSSLALRGTDSLAGLGVGKPQHQGWTRERREEGATSQQIPPGSLQGRPAPAGPGPSKGQRWQGRRAHGTQKCRQSPEELAEAAGRLQKSRVMTRKRCLGNRRQAVNCWLCSEGPTFREFLPAK